jgi:hypothetical protein
VSGTRGTKTTFPVSDEVFKAVYDSPRSLPGAYKWVTPDGDVRKVEEILRIPTHSIGAPLWVSGDTKHCPHCGRLTTWLDIVSSALNEVHRRALLVSVILGEQKFVNVESPQAIAGLLCYQCNNPISDLRSFKCHNWAYALEAIDEIIAESTDPIG